MKVYCTEFYERDHGLLLSWHASRRAAEAELARMRREHGEPQGSAGVVVHDIPTTRAGLIAWLNKHFDVDGG